MPVNPPNVSSNTSTENLSETAHAIRMAQQRYWRKNVALMSVLLFFWALVSLGGGILFADTLNNIASVGGVPLGFWFAQQGSVIVFVILILVYATLMNALDNSYHRQIAHLSADTPHPPPPPPNATSTATATATTPPPNQTPASEGGDA